MTAARRQRRREADDDVPKAGTPIQDPVLKNVKPGPDVEPALHDLLKGAGPQAHLLVQFYHESEDPLPHPNHL